MVSASNTRVLIRWVKNQKHHPHNLWNGIACFIHKKYKSALEVRYNKLPYLPPYSNGSFFFSHQILTFDEKGIGSGQRWSTWMSRTLIRQFPRMELASSFMSLNGWQTTALPKLLSDCRSTRRIMINNSLTGSFPCSAPLRKVSNSLSLRVMK